MKRIVVSAAAVICAVVPGTAWASAGPGVSTGTSTVWRVQRTPPGIAGLVSVSCPEKGVCTAIGAHVMEHGSYTLAERYSGGTWTVQPTPTPGNPRIPSTVLEAVSCPSVRSCTAVGVGPPSGALVEHWNGTRWAVQTAPIPAGSGGAMLLAVSCPAANDCTAVGQFAQPGHSDFSLTLAEHWNGTRWAVQRTPNPAKAALSGSSLSAVSCPSATDCTAVGTYTISNRNLEPVAEHWNGVRWTIERMQSPSGAVVTSPTAVSCSSARVCTAVGRWGGPTPGPTNERALAERWNGKVWTLQAVGLPAGVGLSGVSCPSARSCTALGDGGGQPRTAGLVEHWNGARWTAQATPVLKRPGTLSADLLGVSCLSATDCTAVGTVIYQDPEGSRFGAALAEHEQPAG